MSLASYRAAPPRVIPLSGTCLRPAGREWNYTRGWLTEQSLDDDFRAATPKASFRRSAGAAGARAISRGGHPISSHKWQMHNILLYNVLRRISARKARVATESLVSPVRHVAPRRSFSHRSANTIQSRRPRETSGPREGRTRSIRSFFHYFLADSTFSCPLVPVDDPSKKGTPLRRWRWSSFARPPTS